MGPQVKSGTHSVRRGTPSVPVAALARGALSPLLLYPTSIHPTLCPSTRHPSLMLLCHAESPRNALPLSLPPSTFFPSRSPSTPSLIHPSLPPPLLSLPPSLPLSLLSHRLHPSLSPFSPSLINHPYMTPVAKLLNYHTFVMSLQRTRDTVLIACS